MNAVEKIGQCGIYAKLIKSSVSEVGDRFSTFELEYPRYIHSEFMTHRAISKNASSCLHGDTMVYFDQPNGVKKDTAKSYKVKLSTLYERWNAGTTFDTSSVIKDIPTDNVDPDAIYKEQTLSVLVFKSRSRIGCLRRNDVNFPSIKTDGGFFVRGSDFIQWAKQRPKKISRLTGSRKQKISMMNICTLNEDTGLFTHSKIVDIMYSGKKPTYEIKIAGGYTLKCSADHRIFTDSGWKTLNDMGLREIQGGEYAIQKGVMIACNGVDAYKDIDWLISQRDLGLTLREIASINGWNEKSVRTFSEKNRIKFSHRLELGNENLQYKDAVWLRNARESGYTCGYIANICNTTEDRVKKSCKKHKITGVLGSILSDGSTRTSWNIGLTYSHSPETIARNKNNPNMWKRGKDSIHWRGGPNRTAPIRELSTRFISSVRVELMEKYGWKCAISGESQNLEIHHIDPIWNCPERVCDIDNIIVLSNYIHTQIHAKHIELEFKRWLDLGNAACEFSPDNFEKNNPKKINKPISTGSKLARKFEKIISVKYIGDVDVYDIEVEGPYHNFVADGVVVHNSRAVPLSKAISNVNDNPASPIHWGAAQTGMQASNELIGESLLRAKELWRIGIDQSMDLVKEFDKIGAHKQYASRWLETGQMIKVIASGTDWDNFIWLRDDAEAQPEFGELASLIRQCLEESTPTLLRPGEWHVPYITTKLVDNVFTYFDSHGNVINVETAKKISASCCAQVSYRRLDDSVDKAVTIYNRLFSGKKLHMSPVEHIGTPIKYNNVGGQPTEWEPGVTHIKRNGDLCSGNLTGWIQMRQLLSNNVYVKP